MLLMAQSSQTKTSWDRLEAFLSRVLRSELLLTEAFEDQCLVLLRQEWPKVGRSQHLQVVAYSDSVFSFVPRMF